MSILSYAAVIVAAGSNRRLPLDVPKIYIKIAGKEVLRWSLEKFINHPQIKYIATVVNPNHQEFYQPIFAELRHPKLLAPILGGTLRQDSVLKGLEALLEQKPDKVLIHDAARPFFSIKLLADLIITSESEEAVIPAIPVTDTVKRVHSNYIIGSENRNELWLAQTPQSFNFGTILELHRHNKSEITDDASLCELNQIKVKILNGEKTNYKLTTKEDLTMAKLTYEENQIRLGHGFFVLNNNEFGSSNICIAGLKLPLPTDIFTEKTNDLFLATFEQSLTNIQKEKISQLETGNKVNSQQLNRIQTELEEIREQILTLDVSIITDLDIILESEAHIIETITSLLAINPRKVRLKINHGHAKTILGEGSILAISTILTLNNS